MTDITIPGQVPSLPSNSTPLMTTTMTPALQTKGVRVDVDVLYLDDIPKAMEKMGWTVSAQLMRRWFATKPAYVMPSGIRGGTLNGEPLDYGTLPIAQIDDKTVKMKWLLGFERTLEPFERLSQGWNTERARDLLRYRLKKCGWSSGKEITLGNRKMTAPELDISSQINFTLIGELTDTFDDLYGAIFKANLKLALVGKTSRSWLSKQDTFEIERMGVYLRDTYDFTTNGSADEFYGLGVWSKDRLLNKRETLLFKASSHWHNAAKFPNFVPVKNTDFRRWQAQKNEGGDFFVFSDVLWIPPNIEYVAI